MAANGDSHPSNGVKPQALDEHNLTTRTKDAFQPNAKALPAHFSSYSQSTKSIHADDPLNLLADVAPPIHTSTTFRYSRDPAELKPFRASDRPDKLLPFYQDTTEHVYSRVTTHSTSRLEAILEQIIGAPCVTYSSGLSSLHALLCYLNPKRVSIGDGYHGSHGVLRLHTRLNGLRLLPLDCPASDLEQGDLILLETPVNPYGLAFDISAYAAKAHSRGAYLLVDSTFAPPPLQDPFAHGADCIMHSGTKYLGGHSDMLCGVLAIRTALAPTWIPQLLEDREFIGAVMGSLEGWLGVRSVRTMELRVLRQSQSTDLIVAALHSALTGKTIPAESHLRPQDITLVKKVLKKIHHASLQPHDDPSTASWLTKQMPNGFGPVFSIELHTEDLARILPSKLFLFHHATSLGGVESLIEWRTMSDATVSRGLLRVSVGIEAWEDLLADLVQAFGRLVEEFGL